MEIFYGEDEQGKIAHLDQIFKIFQTQIAKQEILTTSRIHFKAFARVLSDDYKKSPELTLFSLRNMHIILKNAETVVRQEIIEENPVDVFLITVSKVFSWETRRLTRVYARYCDSILQNENIANTNTDVSKIKSNEGLSEGNIQKKNAGKANAEKGKDVLGSVVDSKANTLKDKSARDNSGSGPALQGKSIAKDSKEQKILRTMNMNLLKQTKIYTLIVLIIKEYFGFIRELDESQVEEFQNYFTTIGMTEHLVRCLDYEDPVLLKSVILLLTEINNEKIVMSLIEKGILTRIARFINNKDTTYVINLIFEILKFSKAREKLTLSFLKEVVGGLEKGNIANSLAVLNLLSLEKEIQDPLLELEVHNQLMNVALACFKKDDKKDGKKLLWNVLINLSTQKKFVGKFLRHPSLGCFFENLVQKQSESCFKFLENLFWFSDDVLAKQQFSNYAGFLMEFLENTDDDSDNIRIPAAINILGDVYTGKERKPITILMKLVKRPQVHFQTYIALFGFLNKALYAMPNCHDLVNAHVAEYSLKHFFLPNRKTENEGSFQFLFFLHNLVVLRKVKIDLGEFLGYVDSFDFINVRLIALVLNCFDAFLSLALWNKENTSLIFKKKIECFRKLLQKINQGVGSNRYHQG